MRSNVSSSSAFPYKVVFWGQPHADVSQSDLASRFAILFKVHSQEQLKRFFTGRIVVLKSGLSEAQARAYVIALERIGGQARMEKNQVVRLEGELARRHAPSFLTNDLNAEQMSLTPIDKPVSAPESASSGSRSMFEAREVNSRF